MIQPLTWKKRLIIGLLGILSIPITIFMVILGKVMLFVIGTNQLIEGIRQYDSIVESGDVAKIEKIVIWEEWPSRFKTMQPTEIKHFLELIANGIPPPAYESIGRFGDWIGFDVYLQSGYDVNVRIYYCYELDDQVYILMNCGGDNTRITISPYVAGTIPAIDQLIANATSSRTPN